MGLRAPDMEEYANRVFKNAPKLIGILESVATRPTEEVANELRGFVRVGSDPASPGPVAAEDFEHAMHHTILSRLETGESHRMPEVAAILDVCSALVLDLFQQASQPNAGNADMERCKSWLHLLLNTIEDVARIIPTHHIGMLVDDLERSLVRLTDAYCRVAKMRLAEYDARVAAEQKRTSEEAKAAATAAGKDGGKEGGGATAAGGKALKSEEKRHEERKKQVTTLGLYPNAQMYLLVTALLKQLAMRVSASGDAALRARIMLLLEQVLLMDHKAIANNSKSKATDFIEFKDLDSLADSGLSSSKAPAAVDDPPAAEVGKADAKDAPEAAADGSKVEAAAATATTTTTTTVSAAESAAATTTTTATTTAATAATASTASSSAPGEASSSTKEKEPSAVNKKDAHTALASAIDYEFYTAFWSLQEGLHNPDRILDAKGWSAYGVSFQAALTQTIKYMESNPTQDDTSLPWVPFEKFPLRLAPRGWALELQLEQPQFRLVFLTQVMICFHTIENKSTQAATGKPSDGVRKIIASLRQTCERLLERTRPGFSKTLNRILEKEAQWLNWKLHGCQEFEPESLQMLNMQKATDKLPEEPERLRSGKVHLLPYINSVLKHLKEPQWNLLKVPVEGQGHEEEELTQALRISSLRQTCEQHLDRLLEEDKPENCIEEEYKAKKNRVFMWQCRRLFSLKHLKAYASKDAQGSKADFMDFVHIAKGKPLPRPPKRGGAEGAGGADGATAAATITTPAADSGAAAAGAAPATSVDVDVDAEADADVDIAAEVTALTEALQSDGAGGEDAAQTVAASSGGAEAAPAAAEGGREEEGGLAALEAEVAAAEEEEATSEQVAATEVAVDPVASAEATPAATGSGSKRPSPEVAAEDSLAPAAKKRREDAPAEEATLA